MAKEHTNNELSILIENLEGKLVEKHEDLKETLARIETQTIKTNGRVNELEKWKWMGTGVISILTGIVLPIAFILIKNLKL